MRGMLLLLAAIGFEITGSTLLKISQGFTVLLPSLGTALGFLGSFVCLGLALKYIPLSGAYATWSGLGTALTAGIGVWLFAESFSVLKAAALLLIIIGVIMLNHGYASGKETGDNSPG